MNTSSGAGVVGIVGQAAYTATKHGVVGLTKCAALDYAARNVRINAICPGIIETPMMDRFSGGTEEGRARVIAQEPIGRMGRPEEIAEKCGVAVLRRRLIRRRTRDGRRRRPNRLRRPESRRTVDLQLTGKTALISAASAGIGRATALALGREGAQTIILARRENELRAARR